MRPYRVQWRCDLTSGWSLAGDCNNQDEARERAAECRQKWGGQSRIVAQHVIEVQGLGGITAGQETS
jgi:hypothetical protein